VPLRRRGSNIERELLSLDEWEKFAEDQPKVDPVKVGGMSPKAKKPPSSRPKWWRLLRWVGAGLVVLGLVAFGVFSPLMSDDICQGVTVDGIPLGGMTQQEAQTTIQGLVQRKLDTLQLTLYHENETYTLTAQDLGATDNRTQVLGDAIAASQGGNWFARLGRIRRTRAQGLALTLIVAPSALAAENQLTTILNAIDEPAQNARLVYNASATPPMGIIAEANGRSVDRATLLARATETIDQGGGYLTIPTSPVAPTRTAQDLQQAANLRAQVTLTLPESLPAERAALARQAASAIGGKVIEPGGSARVSDWVRSALPPDETLARLDADPRYADGPGGGISWASSAVYQALLLGEMTVVERTASEYPPEGLAGLGARVTGGHNLTFRNDTELPALLVVTVADNTITVRLYGAALDDDGTAALVVETDVGALPNEAAQTITDPTGTLTEPVSVPARPRLTAKVYRVVTNANGEQVSKELLGQDIYPARPAVTITPAQ